MIWPDGIREAHAHLDQIGRAKAMLALDECVDLDDCLDRVVQWAARAGPGDWILGAGLRVQSWPDPIWPDRDRLDAVTGQRPCCLWSFDHHALVGNSAALSAARISQATPDPPSGHIQRDGQGRPTGVLLESAASMLWKAVPAPSADERRGHLVAALEYLAGLGYVEVHDLKSPACLGPELARLDDAGELPLSVRLYPPIERIEREFESATGGDGAWQRDRVVLGGAKLFTDGTLNSRTAWMLEAYADPLPGLDHGQAMCSPGQIEEAIRRVDRLGLHLACHAIGDAAVRAVLDAIESVRPRTPGFRIEHAELIDADDVPRFADLGVVCSVQACHLLPDIDVLRRSLGHRLDRVLPLRDLIDAGCGPGQLLWFGSDAPIVRADPGDSIQAAVHRCRPGDGPDGVIAPEQAITIAEAGSAFAIGTEPGD